MNLATLEPYERGDMVALANALVRRHAFSWVNEDLALGLHRGQAPALPAAALPDGRRAKRGDREHEAGEPRSGGSRADRVSGVCRRRGVLHWADPRLRLLPHRGRDCRRRGDVRRGSPAFVPVAPRPKGARSHRDLERLPLDRCFEIRLSGCEIAGERFYGRHHGLLIDEELELLVRLLECCPNVHAVTYEEPLVFAERSANDATQKP